MGHARKQLAVDDLAVIEIAAEPDDSRDLHAPNVINDRGCAAHDRRRAQRRRGALLPPTQLRCARVYLKHLARALPSATAGHGQVLSAIGGCRRLSSSELLVL